ncbi:zinc finger protein [Sesbania bispinosa]|nr:zinc finger protein [Sesbania bispinosa]
MGFKHDALLVQANATRLGENEESSVVFGLHSASILAIDRRSDGGEQLYGSL